MILNMKPFGGKTARLPMSCAISATNVHGVALLMDPPNVPRSCLTTFSGILNSQWNVNLLYCIPKTPLRDDNFPWQNSALRAPLVRSLTTRDDHMIWSTTHAVILFAQSERHGCMWFVFWTYPHIRMKQRIETTQPTTADSKIAVGWNASSELFRQRYEGQNFVSSQLSARCQSVCRCF